MLVEKLQGQIINTLDMGAEGVPPIPPSHLGIRGVLTKVSTEKDDPNIRSIVIPLTEYNTS